MLVRAEVVVRRGGEFIALKLQAQCELEGSEVSLTGFSVAGQDRPELPRVSLVQLSHREMKQAFRALAEDALAEQKDELCRQCDERGQGEAAIPW
jgi:hypothetical protein